MAAVASTVFQRKDGRWVALYKHDGKRVSVYGKTEESVIRKRQEILDSLNRSPFDKANLFDNIESEIHSEIYKTLEKEKCELFDNKSNLDIYKTNSIPDHNIIDGNTLFNIASKNSTLGGWLSEWLDTYIKPSKGISTYTCYEIYIYKHIIPLMGSIYLCDLTTEILQNFFVMKEKCGRLDGKPGGMSPKSIENMRFMLNSAMRNALEKELISENPIKKIRTGKVQRSEAVALSTDEQTRLITVCEEYGNLSAFGVVLSIHLGLQLGELLALKWSDIDIMGQKIYVRRSLNRCNITDGTGTKSTLHFSDSKARRIINGYDICDGANFFLKLEIHRNNQQRLYGNVPDTVVASSSGGLVDPKNYHTLFKRLLERSNISNANFDVLRNTFAVRYLENGLDPISLHRVLGCGESSRTLDKINRILKMKTP